MEILKDQNEEQTKNALPATQAEILEFYNKANEVLQARMTNAKLDYEILAYQIRKIGALNQLASMMTESKETPDQSDSSENTDTRDNLTKAPASE
jgi:hypothetical protein